MALDILNDNCYTDCMHLPPLLEQQRSASPKSVSGFTSEAFFGKDCHAIYADDEDEDEDIDSLAIDPLPLTTTASTDLRHLMQDYFGHNDILKEILPKTRLTFYEDREHKLESSDTEMDDDEIMAPEIEEIETEVKETERNIHAVSFEERIRFLPEFPLTTDDENDDENHGEPYRFFVSTEAYSYDHAPAITELSSKPLLFESRTVTNSNKRVKTKTKPASKKKVPAKNKNKNKSTAKNKIKKESAEAINNNNSRIVSETWDLNYMKLASFYLQHGHSSVLRSDADRKLSGWVKRQRNNLKEGKLSPSQINRLDDLDFIWNRLEGAWYDKYNQLKVFSKKSGKTEVPTRYNRSLAEWTQRQRREYRCMKPTMTVMRIGKLESIPCWNWSKNEKNQPMEAGPDPA
jgi:hypothetical protein